MEFIDSSLYASRLVKAEHKHFMVVPYNNLSQQLESKTDSGLDKTKEYLKHNIAEILSGSRNQ